MVQSYQTTGCTCIPGILACLNVLFPLGVEYLDIDMVMIGGGVNGSDAWVPNASTNVDQSMYS